MAKLPFVVVMAHHGSNAIALGVLVKYYDMGFSGALKIIKHKVKEKDIKEIHISKLKELLGQTKEKIV
jgi:hypothetical protein